jgi:hypothetical protein
MLALRLSSWLEAQGWTTWRDKSLVADDTRNENIAELNRARAVIVLWSVDSVGSPHILYEAIVARDARKLLHVKAADVDHRRIPISLKNEVVLDAHDLPSIGRAVAGILGGGPAVRHVQLGEAQSLAVADPGRDHKRALVITRLTMETGQEAVELRASLQRVQRKRAALVAIGACLATLAVVALLASLLTDAIPSAQSGLSKLLAIARAR